MISVQFYFQIKCSFFPIKREHRPILHLLTTTFPFSSTFWLNRMSKNNFPFQWCSLQPQAYNWNQCDSTQLFFSIIDHIFFGWLELGKLSSFFIWNIEPSYALLIKRNHLDHEEIHQKPLTIYITSMQLPSSKAHLKHAKLYFLSGCTKRFLIPTWYMSSFIFTQHFYRWLLKKSFFQLCKTPIVLLSSFSP